MTHTELARAFERGELNFNDFMETAVTPEKFVVKNAKRRGRRAAAVQGALISEPVERAEFQQKVAAAQGTLVTSPCLHEDINHHGKCMQCGKQMQPEFDESPLDKEDVAGAPQQTSLTDEQGPYVPAPGNLKTAIAALKFIVAGNAYFTVRSLKTGVRYTFRVSLGKAKEGYCNWCHGNPCKCVQPYFVNYLSGPENTSDYTYLGWIKDNQFSFTRASKRLAESTVYKAFRYVWQHLAQHELPPQTEIWHMGKCGVCGHPLTVPESIESGIGPVCAGKEGM